MLFILGLFSLVFILIGHFFRLRRWEEFIKIYEKPSRKLLLHSLSLGYLLNCFVPFRLGEIFRAYYAGRKMKSGIGFALATIVVDRLLDVFAVTFIFIMLLVFMKGNDDIILQSVVLYVLSSLFLLIFFLSIKYCSEFFKREALRIGSIFNDSIKLAILKFFWSVINAFRDIWQIGFKKIFSLTCAMWLSYITSHVCFACFLSYLGKYLSFRELFIFLFSKPNLAWEAMYSSIVNSISIEQIITIVIYMLLPCFIMLFVTAPAIAQALTGFTKKQKTDDTDYLKLLPQIEKKDQLAFLDQYFSSKNRDNLKKYIELNHNINVLADYSAGSNATTILCMDDRQTFWRKYAFDGEADKLKHQVEWLCSSKGGVPLCEILRHGVGNGYCCYDMKYNSNAVNMFRYIHTHPLQNSEHILKNVLNSLEENLYKNCYIASQKDVKDYLENKVNKNLRILQSKLKNLTNYEKLIINGQEYHNLPFIAKIFDNKYLSECFFQETCSVIHGDLTIENIICVDDSYYLIDPNTGNILDSPLLDYGKLMQSLHGGYEFMMMTKFVNIRENHIDFSYTVSSAYKELLSFYQDYLKKHFRSEQIRNIYLHEIIHWLRLMPYKINKDTERAPMFYAGLIMVANDVYRKYC